MEKNKKPEALKVQEIVETVVPPDFDKSQLLTLHAEVLVEKLQIEKLGSLTEWFYSIKSHVPLVKFFKEKILTTKIIKWHKYACEILNSGAALRSEEFFFKKR